MDRRNFLRMAGLGFGAMAAPSFGGRNLLGAITPVPGADRKAIADTALEAATGKGASYADVRIARYLNQFIVTREDRVENIVDTESYGCGVRVLVDGAWGFAATSSVSVNSVAAAAAQAVAIAKANARLQTEPPCT